MKSQEGNIRRSSSGVGLYRAADHTLAALEICKFCRGHTSEVVARGSGSEEAGAPPRRKIAIKCGDICHTSTDENIDPLVVGSAMDTTTENAPTVCLPIRRLPDINVESKTRTDRVWIFKWALLRHSRTYFCLCASNGHWQKSWHTRIVANSAGLWKASLLPSLPLPRRSNRVTICNPM